MRKNINASVTEINKLVKDAYKKEGAAIMGDDDRVNPVYISTGSVSLNKALGGKGLACGRISVFFGDWSTGKTTVALMTIANAQKNGLMCAYVDVERTFEPAWATKMGVDVSELLVYATSCGEEAVDVIEKLLSDGFGMIVVDSIASLVPTVEIEDPASKQQMGLRAKLVKKLINKVNARNTGTLVLFLNQVQERIGILYGNPEYQPGGKALMFNSSVQVRFSKGEHLVEEGEKIGRVVKAVVTKNKLAPPLQVAQFNLLFKEGIDRGEELFRNKLLDGSIIQKGGWYLFTVDETQVQGKEAAIERCKEEINGS